MLDFRDKLHCLIKKLPTSPQLAYMIMKGIQTH